MQVLDFLRAGSPAAANVSRETLERLDVFQRLVIRWNHSLNLVSRVDAAELWSRHVADSLQWAKHVPLTPDPAMDLGTGGGFPGLVLAIATGRHFHLVEADKRKAAFLREAARATGAPVTVTATRAESLACKTTLITARAVARLPRLLALRHPLLEPPGICLFAKGRSAGEELAEAESTWRMTVQILPSATAPDGVLLRISDLRPR